MGETIRVSRKTAHTEREPDRGAATFREHQPDILKTDNGSVRYIPALHASGSGHQDLGLGFGFGCFFGQYGIAEEHQQLFEVFVLDAFCQFLGTGP